MMTAILFDESHGQPTWWGVAPTLASGFKAATALAGPRLSVAYARHGSVLTPALLADYRALVLAVGPQGKTHLSDDEIHAVQAFVRAGGGLLALSIYTGDWHHEANLNHLLEPYGIVFNRDVVMPPGSQPVMGFVQGGERSPTSACAATVQPLLGADPAAALCQGVAQVQTLSSCSLYVDEDAAVGVLQADASAVILEPLPRGAGIHIDKYLQRGLGPAVVMAASRSSRVAAVGSWKNFLDAFLADPRFDNRQLFLNLLDWLTAGAPAAQSAPAAHAASLPSVPPAAALRERLQDLRALLAAVEHEAVLATGYEKAALSVRIARLNQEIAATEAAIDEVEGS